MYAWLLAQAESSPYLVVVFSALAGLLGAVIPGLVKAIRAKRREDRADWESGKRITAAEYEKLLEELRAERVHLRQERTEREQELSALREEHTACLQRAAEQDARLNEFQRTVERLESEVKELRRQHKGTVDGDPGV